MNPPGLRRRRLCGGRGPLALAAPSVTAERGGPADASANMPPGAEEFGRHPPASQGEPLRHRRAEDGEIPPPAEQRSPGAGRLLARGRCPRASPPAAGRCDRGRRVDCHSLAELGAGAGSAWRLAQRRRRTAIIQTAVDGPGSVNARISTGRVAGSQPPPCGPAGPQPSERSVIRAGRRRPSSVWARSQQPRPRQSREREPPPDRGGQGAWAATRLEYPDTIPAAGHRRPTGLRIRRDAHPRHVPGRHPAASGAADHAAIAARSLPGPGC
jgi:hypothetical protein